MHMSQHKYEQKFPLLTLDIWKKCQSYMYPLAP